MNLKTTRALTPAHASIGIFLAFFVCFYASTTHAAGRAVNDSATTKKANKVTVDVIRNDSGFNRKNYRVKVIRQPKNGNAWISGSKRVVYNPRSNFVGKDSIVYRLQDNKGYNKTATVTVTVKKSSSGNSSPKRAVNDNAITKKGNKVTVNVTKNDSGFNKNNFKIKITRGPRKGSAKVEGGKRIAYKPNGNFVGTDTIKYRLTDNRGFSKTATLTVKVKKSLSNNGGSTRGADSAKRGRIILQWKKNPKHADGYIVRFGPKSSNAVLQVADISLNRGTLDPNAPSVVLFADADLGLKKGDKACFVVQAYNDKGYSKASAPKCANI